MLQLTPRVIIPSLFGRTALTRPAHSGARSYVIKLVVLILGALLLSSNALYAGAAEPSKESQTAQAPQTSPTKVLWSREFTPEDAARWQKKYPKTSPGFAYLGISAVVPTSDGILMAAFLAVEGLTLNTYVINLEKNGALRWQKSYGGMKGQVIRRIAEVDNGYLLVGAINPLAALDEKYREEGGDQKPKFWALQIDKSGQLLEEFISNELGDVSSPYVSISNNQISLIQAPSFCDDKDTCYGLRAELALDGKQKISLLKKSERFLVVPKFPSLKEATKAYTQVTQTSDGWLIIGSLAKEGRLWNVDTGFVALFDSVGSLQWAKNIPSPRSSSFLSTISPSVSGYLAIGIADYIPLYSVQSQGTSIARLWVVELDKTGRKLHDKIIETGEPETGIADFIKTPNGYYLTGVAQTWKKSRKKSERSFIIKLDSHGDIQWKDFLMGKKVVKMINAENGLLLFQESDVSVRVTKIKETNRN